MRIVYSRHSFMVLISALILLILSGYGSSLLAAEWKVDGNIDQSLYYDDNFRMAVKPVGSLIYLLKPTIRLGRKTDVWDAVADASYGLQSYSDPSTREQNPQRYGFLTKYRTELGIFGLNSSYSITPTRNTALLESGNFASNAENKNWTVSPSYSYQLTEIDSLAVTGMYSQSTYSATDFSNNDNRSINLAWQRQWSERLSYSVSTFYSQFDSVRKQLSVTSDSYGVILSTSYQLSEQWQLNGSVGGRMTDTTQEFEIIPGLMVNDKSSALGFLTNLNARYTGERLKSSISLDRSLVPSSQGQLTEQTVLSADLSYQLSERLTGNLGASYQETDSAGNNSVENNVFQNNNLSRINYNFNAGLSWRLTPDWNLSASYQHRQQESKNSGGIKADSNLIMLMLNYNWSGLSISR